MLRVALTGGIATGKSYVLSRFAVLGVPTIDADQLARDVVQPGQPAWRAIRDRFGAGMIAADGTVDRPQLAKQIFADPAARADLEKIVHPPVRTGIARWFQRCEDEGNRPFAVADIPLLFETGRADEFDRVIVTVCDPETQLRRLTMRDGLSETEGRQRLASQLPSADKVGRANFVITTGGSFEETDEQVRKVYRALCDAR